MRDEFPPEYADDEAPPCVDEQEPVHYFCRLTFGQFFTLVVLLVVTVCSTFYLGARYGNYYLRLDGTSINETAKLPQLQPLPTAAPAAAPINEAQQEAIQDTQLKHMARQALRREQQQHLEQQVQAYINAPVPPQPSAAANPGRLSSQAVVQVPSRQDAPGTELPAMEPTEGDQGQGQVPSGPAAGDGQPQQPPQAAAIPRVTGAGTPYTVQLGAYQNYNEANAHVEEWKAKGYPVYLTNADLPDSGRWYRVRVGTFATRGEAQSFREEFGRRESINGIVVRNE